jgi:hypothetical protein
MFDVDSFIEWAKAFEQFEKEREDAWYKEMGEIIDKYLEHVKNQRVDIFKNLI